MQQPEPDDKLGYKAIAAELRAAITTGTISENLTGLFENVAIKPGSKLPSETQLVGAYKVSRGTIRDALAALRAEGLVEARKGAGVYIRAFRPLVRNATERLSKKVWGQGRSIWAVDLEARQLSALNSTVEKVPAPEMVAACFGIPVGAPVWVRDRDYEVEGRVVQRATSYLPVSIVEGSAITQPDTGAGGTYARLAELGHAPVTFREELKSRMPSVDEAARLGLAAGTPVIEIARTAFDEAGTPVEVNLMLLDASSYILQYDFTS